MRLISKAVVLSVGLFVSSAAMAECPVELPFEKLMDCIVEEGAGGVYPVEKVMKEINAQQAEGKQSMSVNAQLDEEV